MEKHLNEAAKEQGFKDYECYFDWVTREGEKAIVSAQLIEAIYKKAIKLLSLEMLVINYSGDFSIESLEEYINNTIGS